MRIEAEGRLGPTIREALVTWFLGIAILSGLALLGPLLVPWWHTRNFDLGSSFGNGELFGWSLALSAAALLRWLANPRRDPSASNWRTVYSFMLGVTGVVIALEWTNLYINPSKPFLDPGSTVPLSVALAFVSIVLGAWAEIAFVRAGRSAVVEVP